RTPVRVMRFDSSAEDAEAQARALGIEAGENEQRRDYTRADVKRLLERLEAAGYRTDPGRPKKGERAAIPVIQTVIGKSRAQVFRLLREKGSEAPAETVPRETVSESRDREIMRRAIARYLDQHLAA